MAEKISFQNVAEAAQEYSCLFGANKNLYRVIPSIADGLKPGRRRLYWSWWEEEHKPQNINPETMKRLRFIKTATLASSAMRYHPHGDTANKEIIDRDGQTWNNNVMMIQPQGNFGNIYGSRAASGRYTMAKLSPYIIDCFFSDFDSYCVPMKESYDGDRMEPEFFPAKYPHVLFNPQMSGIGYGQASNIPPFNVGEVLKATIKLIKDPKAKVMLVPDSPTGADIIDEGNFKDINETGVSKFTLRANCEIDHQTNTIHISSLPLLVTSSSVIDKIVELKKKNKFEEIISFNDSTKNDVVDIELMLKNDANPDKIMKELYSKTNLRMTYPVGITVIDDYHDYSYGVKNLLLSWIDYRKDIVRSMFNNKLQQVEEKIHMNDVLIMVSNASNAEETLQICKTSKNRKEIEERLVKRYKITSLQANTLAGMPLYRFSKEAYLDYLNKKEELNKELKYIYDVLDSDDLLDDFIIKQLEDGIKKYARPRMSNIIVEDDEKVNIPNTKHLIAISTSGYIKKISLNNPSDSIGLVGKTNENLTVMDVMNRETILVFDSSGIVTKIPVASIPNMKYEDTGIELERYFKVNGTVVGTLQIPSDNVDSYLDREGNNLCLFIVTKMGYAKRLCVSDFKKSSSSTSIIKLNDKDEVSTVLFTREETVKDIIIYTNLGDGIRRDLSDIKISQKSAKGVVQISLRDDEEVVGASKFDPSKKRIFYITNQGKVKVTETKYFPVMTRKSDSISLINLGARETLVGVASVSKNDVVIAYRKNNEPVRLEIRDIPVSTRASMGEKMVKTPKGDSVVAFKVFSSK